GVMPLQSEPEYDLIIITPSKFSLGLKLLMNHKNQKGVSTKIVTTESIYLNYKGRDKQEDIKLFIKDAIEKWNITYVLLVGARQKLGYRWALPARYSNLEDKGGWNETYVSDLYYADIYRYNNITKEIEFDDWDSNGNDIFAEWKWTWNGYYWTWPVTSKDVMDLYPDVYVGRLACRDLSEVLTVVRKIINYENNAYNQSWFKEMIVVGGDTTPYDDGIAEGEYETNYAAVIMESIGFNVTRLWTSTGNLTSSKDVIETVRKGAGFLYLSGHGSPIVWSTHPYENESWIDGLWNDEMNDLKNRGKLPICVVGGCHNSQFDVAPANMINGILKLGLKYFTWIEDENCFGKLAWLRRCWSWNLIRQRNGGSIATIGNTGLGWGTPGEGCIEGLDGFITSHFFEVYNTSVLNDPGNITLGLVHSQTINLYIQTFEPNDDELDRKTIEQWVLLGDPSLKIGGYPN
ncbi:MAG: C25 family cysteine peptidase, partial [Candidatus Thermoplasmatota archaeon]|nr:C25 family cysteine peptidase [Candidatus Thermoplasmatota archaeon]